jgi:hypothetical protein
LNPPNLYWFKVTTKTASGNVAINQYDCIIRASRAYAWWIGRPMETFTETMRNRGVLVSVEPL